MAADRSHRNLFFLAKIRPSMSDEISVRLIDRESRDGEVRLVQKSGYITVRVGRDEHSNGC